MTISGVLQVVEEPRLVNIWIALTTENRFGLFVTLHICVKYNTQQKCSSPKGKKRKYMGGLKCSRIPNKPMTSLHNGS